MPRTRVRGVLGLPTVWQEDLLNENWPDRALSGYSPFTARLPHHTHLCVVARYG